MKIEIENMHVVRVINFLDSFPLKGLKSIHRTNLSRLLQEKLKVIAENEKQLMEELKDDKDKLMEELEKFHKEKVVIDGGDSQAMLQAVKSVIKEIVEKEEMEFSRDDAYALACLYEAFELGGEE